jgi:hypothetical protein
LGPNHPNVGSTCRSLGTVLHDQGDLAAAKTQMTRAYTIFQAAFGPNHPSTQGVARWLAEVRYDEGEAELSS